MKARLIFLFLACAAAGFGQYTWDYTKNPVVSDGTRWSSNGLVYYSSAGVNFYYGGGSLISIPAISGSNSNDYDVTSTLASTLYYGGTYIHFLRASGGTVQAGSGSYISAEIVIPSGFASPGVATLNINQCVSGTVTTLGSTTIEAANGMTFRTVIWGTNLWIYTTNNLRVWAGTVPATTGNPGIGGYGMPYTWGGFQSVSLGHHDTVAPGAVSGASVVSSVFPTSVSLRWPAVADDSIGVGVYEYSILRGGTLLATSFAPEFTDEAVSPSSTYNYQLLATDFHGNTSAPTAVSMTTPAASAADPHRTGVNTTGSYWGGGGEQIDTLSGNLNFSLPLLTAQGRAGWTVPVGLVYNSQNWRQDNGVNWKLGGGDVGYGFGWQMLIGSITPYYTAYYSGIDHYVYTDSTGARHILNVHSGGVWSGADGTYVWFDSSTNKLHFRDGSYWVMGSTSGGSEADAGAMYPTIIEDVSGNQVIVSYASGGGLPSTATNSSARITSIEDSRAYCGNYIAGVGCVWKTYLFAYNTDSPVPHLTGINNWIGTSEVYTLIYSGGVTLGPPFGSDPAFAGQTTAHLSTVTTPTAGPWLFTYDTAGASELLQATFPWGGHLRWTYGSDPYTASRDLRAVSARYLAADALGATEWSYGISRDNVATAGTVVHGTMTLSDASGVGAKTWSFNTAAAPVWQIGLASEFLQSAAAGGTVLKDDLYTWSQDPALNPYISKKVSTIGQGTPNVEAATSTQTLDQYGNVTQSVVYPYNNTTTPLKTFTNTYVSSSPYTSHYIYNLLVASSVTPSGGSAIPLVTNTYDVSANCTGSLAYSIPCSGWVAPGTGPTREIDPSPPIPVGQRGYLNSSVTPAKTTSIAVYTYGSPAMQWGSDGSVSYASADTSTNFSAPATIMSQSYTTLVSYNSWLGVTQTVGANSEQMSMTYDSVGRPATATSPYCGSGCTGPTVTYSYGTSPPFTQTKTGPDGVTTTTLDGLGRAVLVARGDTSGVHSSTQTVYAPCACSPLGKIQQTSQPFVGPSASAWTTYTYDGLGRPTTVVQPDGKSTTRYFYSGNVTTVGDPTTLIPPVPPALPAPPAATYTTGIWKQFTTDVSGNLVTVAEPDPSSGMVYTYYSYDWMNHVVGVSMTRAGTPQTRTFVYDSVGRQTSATNPESGMVSYAWNSDNTLQMKTDAKGQQAVYTYDSLKRLTMKQYYPTGTGNPEDGCQRVTYSYDTNPVNPAFSQNSAGRLTAIQYGATIVPHPSPWPVASCVSGVATTYITPSPASTLSNFTEMYSYHAAGAVTAKQLYVSRVYSSSPGTTDTGALEVDYTYDQAGRTATTTYPMSSPASVMGYNVNLGPITFTYGYDSMGRPASLTDVSGASGAGWYQTGAPVNWVQNVQYDYAGRMTSMQSVIGGIGWSPYTGWAQKTLGYNVNGQLTSLGWATDPYGSYGSYGTAVGVQYNYSPTQNNGQIASASDTLSGETIVYAYDTLKRLTQASSTPNSGSTPAAWTQAYQYDGFGNLTGKVLNGTTTLIPVNAATNRLTSASYDFNGNMTSGSGATLTYDEANRVSSAAEVSGGIEYYGYTADNKRFYKYTATGQEQVTFYGARGEKLGVYSLGLSGVTMQFTPLVSNIWFAGQLIVESDVPTYQDRLGTNRTAPSGGGAPRFYPFGDEITSTANDHEKFATYTRDSYTGFDYADQRYYASTYGRFNTADPYQASAGPGDPGSWNRYSYTRGDPVNRLDPRGLEDCPPGVDFCVTGTAVADSPDPSPCSEFAVMAPWAAAYLSSIGDCGVPSEYGGGGGGYDQKQFVYPPTKPWIPAPPEEEDRSKRVAYEFAEQLLSIPKCAGLFNIGGVGMSPINMLTMLYVNNPVVGSLDFGFINNPAVEATVTRTGAGGVAVTINNNINGLWFGNTKLQDAQTLLHELGHVYEFMYGPDSTAIKGPDGDFQDPTQVQRQNANNDAISANCIPGRG